MDTPEPRRRRALPWWAAFGAVAAAVAACSTAACQPAGPPPITTTTTTTTTTTAAAAPAAVTGDEFNGTALDTARWRPVTGTYGNAGGGSRHCLSPSAVTVSGGALKIASSKSSITCGAAVLPYRSGFAESRSAERFYPLEGVFSVRAKVPAAQGIWPAFWLRHRGGSKIAEVDVMESFHAQAPGRATQALHLDGEVNTANRSTWFEDPAAPAGWHVFAVRIERTGPTGADVVFSFTVDGRPAYSYTDTAGAWVTAADPAATWDVALNTAVDGRWAGDPDGQLGYLDQLGRCSLSGTPPDCDTTGLRRVDWSRPVVFEVDWFRYSPLPAK